MEKELKKTLALIHLAEKLKQELRHSWLSNGRQESVAEHSWRVSLMVILLEPFLSRKINLAKALKISVIHDLVEVEAKDIPAFEHHRQKEKKKNEKSAMEKIKDILSSEKGEELSRLWLEYENQTSYEAKYVRALDKLEVRLQHNEANMNTWNEIEFPRSLFVADKHCKFEKYLKELNDLIKDESRIKIKKAGIDLNKVERKARKLAVDIKD